MGVPLAPPVPFSALLQLDLRWQSQWHTPQDQLLTELAIKTGEQIGPVTADLGNNECQTPFVPDYIAKVQKRGAIGKKRKTAKC